MRLSLILAAILTMGAPHAAAHNHAGSHEHEAAPTANDIVRVEDAWARAAIAGGNGAAYARIVNDGEEADRLIAVKGDAANVVEIHEMSTEGGVMKMRKLDALEVPAKGVAELKPGGNHVMLIGLKDALSEGGALSLTFVFENAGEVAMELPIRKAGGHGHDKH